VPFLGDSENAGDSGDDTAVSSDWMCEPGGSTLIRSESEAVSSLTSTCAYLDMLERKQSSSRVYRVDDKSLDLLFTITSRLLASNLVGKWFLASSFSRVARLIE
jgi:hypothetical protein